MTEKYLKGGALNPIWCDEQDAIFETESIMDCLSDLFSLMDIDLNIQLGEGVAVGISNKNKEPMNMCSILNTESEYEAKFNFIKRHSATPEDLQLAREIIGLE